MIINFVTRYQVHNETLNRISNIEKNHARMAYRIFRQARTLHYPQIGYTRQSGSAINIKENAFGNHRPLHNCRGTDSSPR